MLSLTPGQWVVQPEDYTPLEVMTVEITDDYQSFECSQYRMYWAVGENDEYSIKTVEDLQKLSGSEATYQLKNDIDLSGVNWKPIEGFKGTLIGNGYTIKNLKIESGLSNVGFFATLNGRVVNLNFEKAEIKVTGYQKNIGILCGTLEGSVSSIKVSGAVIADSSEKVGGIAGYINQIRSFEMNELVNTADISGADYVGGIFGGINNNCDIYSGEYTVTLTGLKNEGKITGTGEYVGGLLGYGYFNNSGGGTSYVLLYINNSSNSGDVQGKLHVGGIAGYIYSDNGSSALKNCSNSSGIEAEAYVGCIAGTLKNVRIADCSNEGSTLLATKYIVDSGVKYAYVGGYVGDGYVGGLFGYAKTDSDTSCIIDSTSSGTVTGTENYDNFSGKFENITIK